MSPISTFTVDSSSNSHKDNYADKFNDGQHTHIHDKIRMFACTTHNGSFDEFYYCLKFAYDNTKNLWNHGSVILKKSVSFDW